MEFQKSCTDICFIIENFSIEDREKIPQATRDFFLENKDALYVSKIDRNKNLFEQDLSETTRAFLYIIFFKYFATKVEQDEFKSFLESGENFKDYSNSNLKKEEIEDDAEKNINSRDKKIEFPQNFKENDKEDDGNKSLLIKKHTIFDKIKEFIFSIFKKN